MVFYCYLQYQECINVQIIFLRFVIHCNSVGLATNKRKEDNSEWDSNQWSFDIASKPGVQNISHNANGTRQLPGLTEN